VIPLDTRLFSAMWRDDIDLGGLGPDQTHPRLLISIHATKTRTEIAVPQMRVGERTLLGRIDLAQQLIPRDIVIQEKLRRDSEMSFGDNALDGHRGRDRSEPKRSVEGGGHGFRLSLSFPAKGEEQSHSLCWCSSISIIESLSIRKMA
jgi:hypothetical protein